MDMFEAQLWSPLQTSHVHSWGLDRRTAKSRNQLFNGYGTELSTVSGAILVWGQTRLEIRQMYWIFADFEP